MVLWSSAARVEDDVRDDIQFASDNGTLVGVTLDKTPIPRRLRGFSHSLSDGGKNEDSLDFQKIESALEKLVPRRAVKPADPSLMSVSYTGLEQAITQRVSNGVIRLFVGNLSPRLEAEELRAMFEELAPVSDFFWPIDRETNRKKGFAFVDVSTKTAAHSMIKGMNNREVMGRPLAVNIARPREQR